PPSFILQRKPRYLVYHWTTMTVMPMVRVATLPYSFTVNSPKEVWQPRSGENLSKKEWVVMVNRKLVWLGPVQNRSVGGTSPNRIWGLTSIKYMVYCNHEESPKLLYSSE